MNDADKTAWRNRLRRASRAQMRGWVRAIRREFTIAADDFEAGVFDEINHAHRLLEAYTASYRATGARFYALGTRLIEAQQKEARAVEFRQTSYLERVERLIRVHGPNRVRAVARRTQAIITKTLAEAAGQGLGEREAGRLVRQAISGRMAVARARMIARTEIGAAQNAGMIDAAEQIQVRYSKEWISIEDGRTRLSHSIVDGKKIPREQKFKVGNGELEHPGDPSGPPEEIINCRCTMLLELA